jgi:hypothetical protein
MNTIDSFFACAATLQELKADKYGIETRLEKTADFPKFLPVWKQWCSGKILFGGMLKI